MEKMVEVCSEHCGQTKLFKDKWLYVAMCDEGWPDVGGQNRARFATQEEVRFCPKCGSEVGVFADGTPYRIKRGELQPQTHLALRCDGCGGTHLDMRFYVDRTFAFHCADCGRWYSAQITSTPEKPQTVIVEYVENDEWGIGSYERKLEKAHGAVYMSGLEEHARKSQPTPS